ncbi:MAG: type I methionyl aminopeptidase [Pseudomonadota bacterium]
MDDRTARMAAAPPTERRSAEGIRLHDPADSEGMRRAGRLAAECLDMIGAHVRPGVRTEELDRLCHDFIVSHGATPATLGYRGYQHSSCISVNHVVCHGIPGPKALRDGDILNIDVTVIVDGWHGDTSRMYVAGQANRKAARLIEVTHEALMRGIAEVKPGARFGDIGHAIQSFAEGERCSVVRDFCGHGLGRTFHDAPNVLHYGRRGEGAELQPGMFFTIEPMVNLGAPQTKTLPDNWTAVTRDRSLSAQFEHSVAVTEDGCEIFTLSPAGRFFPGF